MVGEGCNLRPLSKWAEEHSERIPREADAPNARGVNDFPCIGSFLGKFDDTLEFSDETCSEPGPLSFKERDGFQILGFSFWKEAVGHRRSFRAFRATTVPGIGFVFPESASAARRADSSPQRRSNSGSGISSRLSSNFCANAARLFVGRAKTSASRRASFTAEILPAPYPGVQRRVHRPRARASGTEVRWNDGLGGTTKAL